MTEFEVLADRADAAQDIDDLRIVVTKMAEALDKRFAEPEDNILPMRTKDGMIPVNLPEGADGPEDTIFPKYKRLRKLVEEATPLVDYSSLNERSYRNAEDWLSRAKKELES